MNTINRHMSLIPLLEAWLLALCLASCSADEPLPEPAPTPGKTGGAMRFTTSVMPGSRTVHTGMESTFEEGESVGCVIAVKDGDGNFQYRANSQWHYHIDGQTGVLVLDNIWGDKNGSYGKYSESDMAGLKLVRRHPGYEAEKGFIELLDENASYAFHFYYPYIDNDILKQDLTQAVTEWNRNKTKEFHTFPGFPQRVLYPTNTFKFGFNHWDPDIEVNASDDVSLTKFIYSISCIGEISGSYDKPSETWANPIVLTKYSWDKFPYFVNNTQRRKKQFSNSDFLWVSYTANIDKKGDVTKEHETHPVPLTFKRLNAAIELQSDVELPMSSVWFENSNEGIIRGKAINLRDGTTTEYAATGTPDYNDPDKIQKMSAVSKEKFYPLPMDAGYDETSQTGAYKTYRLILPAQDNFKASLAFSLKGKDYTIDLSSQLTRLERNKLYIIRLNARGDWDIIIKPWQDDTSNILIENEPRTE